MPFLLKIHSHAYQENIDAFKWYERQREGLGDEYLDAIEKLLVKIMHNPYAFSILKGKYRHAHVTRFPFTIVYEFSQKKETIHVAAIFHNSRDPKKKIRKEE